VAYADDVNLLGDNIDTINENTDLNCCRYGGWSRSKRRENEVYVGVTWPECRPNRDIKIGNRSFENVSQFKYLGTTVINQNLIQEEIKRRLQSGNACYHLVQNLLSSRLSKNVKIRIYKTIILHVVLYGCETCRGS
jgi:hypothetical protein